MIKRLQKIIAREKIKAPHISGALLLIKRVLKVLRRKLRNIIIHLKKDGTFASQEEMYMCSLFPQKVLDVLIKEMNFKSVLDVGCGTGVSLKYFIDHKIEAFGIENSEVAIAQSLVKDKIIRHNYNRELNLNMQFDCVWSFEVIEHIHPKYENNFLKTLINHSSVIIISGARTGQGGYGHFNEQEPEYWISKFRSLEYDEDEISTNKLKNTKELFSENLLCFTKIYV